MFAPRKPSAAISGISSRGKAAVAEAVADDRENAFVDEAAGGLADQEFLFGELRIDQKVVDASECHEFQCMGALTKPRA